MRKTRWIALVIAGTCAGFTIGAMLGKASKVEEESRSTAGEAVRAGEGRRESGRLRALQVALEKSRKALAERETRVAELEAQLAEVRGKSPPRLTAVEEMLQKELEARRERAKRWDPIFERSKPLRAKLFQWQDKSLRAEGLAELGALVQSEDRDELLVGLTTLNGLEVRYSDLKELAPYIVRAMSHPDADVRRAAVDYALRAVPADDLRRADPSLANDPSPEVRALIAWYSPTREDLLRAFLNDDDIRVRTQALARLWETPAYAQEIEDTATQLSREAGKPEERREVLALLSGKAGDSVAVAKRVIEMYNEGCGYYALQWLRRRVSSEVEPTATAFCLRVLRDSTEPAERLVALEGLRDTFDWSVVAELQETVMVEHDRLIGSECSSIIERYKELQRGLR
jgi:hypothetical protein